MSEIYQSRLKSLAVQERPQERLDKYGPDALSDSDLLAMLVRTGTANLDVMDLSDKLLSQAGSLQGLISWGKEDFMKIGNYSGAQCCGIVRVMRSQ